MVILHACKCYLLLWQPVFLTLADRLRHTTAKDQGKRVSTLRTTPISTWLISLRIRMNSLTSQMARLLSPPELHATSSIQILASTTPRYTTLSTMSKYFSLATLLKIPRKRYSSLSTKHGPGTPRAMIKKCAGTLCRAKPNYRRQFMFAELDLRWESPCGYQTAINTLLRDMPREVGISPPLTWNSSGKVSYMFILFGFIGSRLALFTVRAYDDR